MSLRTFFTLLAILPAAALSGCGNSSSGESSGATSSSASSPPDPGAAPASGPESEFPALGIAVRLPAGAKGSAEKGALKVEGASGIAVQLVVSDDLATLGSFEQQLGDIDLLVKTAGSAVPAWQSKSKNPDGTWTIEYELRRPDGAMAHSINTSYLAGKKAIGCANTSTTDPQIREAVLLCKALAPRPL